MPKSTKHFRASPPRAPARQGSWLVLIGGDGETPADEIEAYFAEIWPEVELEATDDEATALPAGSLPRPSAAQRAH
jgi:hypothetical protein